MAVAIAAEYPGALFLDLERESDRAVLAHPELFLVAQRDRIVVLDEVQFVPGLFEALRPEIDAYRRPGRYLLLGSASGGTLQLQALWLRGGFPLSCLAPNEAASVTWRQDFLRRFLQRDLPQLVWSRT